MKIKGTISQAPALKPGNPLPSWVGIPLKLTYFGVVGRYTDSSKLELSGLSTDLKVIEDYKKDPLNHDRISMQLLSDMVSTSKMLMENASSFKTPLIIYHATKDRLTSVDGSVEFSKVVGSPDKKFKQFEGVEHELHNESSIKDQVIQDYVEWIKSRV